MRIGVAEIPDAEIVVAIGWLNDISAWIELNAHLAEIISEQAADDAADRLVLPFRATVEEHLAALADPGIGVREIRIDQRSRQACHQRQRELAALGLGNVKGPPKAAESRKIAHGEMLDTCVLDQ